MPADTIVTSDSAAALRLPRFRYLEWGPVIAGAVAAAAISFVLFAFGSALGLLAVSPHPYRGLSATSFMIVATLFAAMVQVVSYAAGGYLAGRMRMPWLDGTTAERHFRDGAHGFVVWAIGLLFSALVVASGAGGILKTATEAASAAGSAALATTNPADIATDFLLRPGPSAPDTANAGTANAGTVDRGPLVRTFAESVKTGSLAGPDRTYLAQVVARQTGLSQADAEKRVDDAFAEAKKAEQKVRDAADAARKKAALGGFLTAATLAVACAAACLAAGLGGRDRDEQAARTYWLGTARFW